MKSFYHVTHVDNLPSIKQRDLLSNPPRRNFGAEFYFEGRGQSVFFESYLERARNLCSTSITRYSTSSARILEVHLPDDTVVIRDERNMTSAFRYEGDIPVS